MSKCLKSRLMSVALSSAAISLPAGLSIVVALFVFLLSLSASAQTPQQPNTDSALDNRMRSDATVDPISMSLQLSLNLGSYPGRDGLALPITMNYSSHVWGIHHVATEKCGMSPNWVYYQRYRPEYGRGSMAGWTSPLGMSDWTGTVNLETYDFDGHPVSTGAYKKIARMFAVLPDGSRHELRKDDSLHDPTETITGKFYAVDDSRLVYDTTTGTLYLPDGTRMALSGFIDKNGNKLVAGGSGYTNWTDTMGRSISSPLDTGSNKVGDNTSAVAFDKSFSVPGFNGTLSYTMKWKKLADVLTNTSDTLEYMGDTGNSGTCGTYFPPASPSLFVSTGDETQVLMSTRVFNPVVLAEIDLPNGKSYKFTYNIYGEIDKIVYPTGAYDKFAYTAVEPLNPGLYDGDSFFMQTNRGVVSRTQSEDGTTATEVTWTYGQVGRGINNPDGTYSTIAVYPGTSAGAMKWGFESVIAGLPSEERTYNSSDTMLTRHLIDRTYDSVNVGGVLATRNPRVTREISVKFEPGDSNALVSLVTYDYDSNANPAYFANLNPTVVKQYNYVVVSASTAQTASSAILAGYFSSSVPAKQVETDYLYDSNYLARNLTQVPTEVRIKDGSGNVKAKTHFYYDESSYQLTTSGTMPTAASGTWIDPLTELGSTIGAVRALPTTIRSYYDITNGYYIDTHKFYDQYGNVTKIRDGRGNDTTSAFDASYAFTLPTSGTTPVPDSSGTYGSSSAFTSSTAFDYSSGLPTSSTDINGQTTTISYADPLTSVLDPLLRPRVTTAPNGQQTIMEYGDTAGSLYVKLSSQIDSTNWNVGYKYFDNLGRTIRTRSVDPAGDDYTLTCYNNMGRVSKVTNPFRGYSTQTCSTTTGLDWTSMTYDAEGRVTAVTTPDTAQVTTAYALATSGSPIGTVVTVTDQASKKRKSVTDALGRLTDVYEDPLGVNYRTTYGYDALDNLKTVTQQTQTRTFNYDSLQRLTSATNPESGTISYEYDAVNNLTHKTDARGVVATYNYDALNRNTTIDYSDTASINPDVTRVYDGAANGKGRLWKAYAGGTETSQSTVERLVFDSYDALGRPLVLNQSFKVNNVWKSPYQITRTYNLAGAVTSQRYPSDHVVTYNYDNAGRLADKDALHPAFSGNLGDGAPRTYAQGISYAPTGQLKQEKFGTSTPIYNKLFYNSRQQLAEILASTTGGDTSWNRGKIINDYSLQCSGAGCNATDNNGNLRKQQVYIPGNDQVSSWTSWYQQYDYDSLNRLKRVHEYTGNTAIDWQQEYDYDPLGNRTLNAANTWIGNSANAPNPALNETVFETGSLSVNNRLYAPGDLALPENLRRMRYDAAGNLINDSYTGAGNRVYDAENRMTQAWANSQWQFYTYNADGQRTRRKINNQETWQVYGFDGELLAEYPAEGAANNPTKEYGYRNGQLLISAEAGVASAPPVLADDFNDNSLNPGFWTTYYPGAPTVSEQGQQLQVTLSPNTAAYNGVFSNASYDLTNRMVQVESTQAASQAGWCENYLEVELNANNYFLIQVGAGTMLFRARVNGVNDQTTIAFDGAANRFWRIRHDQNANQIYFETSANDSVWLTRKVVTPGFSLTSLKIDLLAGCYGTGNSSPGIVKYDNVKLLSSTAGSTSLTIPNAGFEAPVLGNGVFQYNPTGGSWTFANGGGISGMNSGFTGSPSSAPEGVQIAFIQATGEVSQSISGFQANSNYVITFSAAQRSNCCNTGGQDIQVYLDSDLKGTFHPSSGSYAEYSTVAFSTTTGAHTVKFVGLNPLGGDHTAFIDNVRINGSPKPGFGIQWLLTDQLGTPRMVFDESGGLNNVKRHDYLPFGEEVSALGLRTSTSSLGYSSGDGVRKQFTQKERDVETGLDYFGARYYSSTLGRFTRPDVPFADQWEADPPSWNLYTYVGNNPTNAIDPLGLWKQVDCDNGGKCWQAEDGDTWESFSKATGYSKEGLKTFFVGETITSGQVFDVSGFEGWTKSLDNRMLGFLLRDRLPEFEPGVGGGLRNVTKAAPATLELVSRVARWLGFGKKVQTVERAIEIVQREGNLVEMVGKSGQGEIRVLTEMTKQGDTLVLKGLHMEGAGPGSMGVRELFQFARQLGREQGVKKVIIEGAERTTGANPGSIPRTVEIKVN